MPGLTGVAALQAGAMLERQEAALYPAPWLPHYRMAVDGFACGVRGAGASSGTFERDGVQLAFEGYLVGDVPRGSALRAWLLERFLERGERFAEELNGSFQLAIHARGRTWLYADLVASRRLFYRHDRGWLAFSPEVAPLAALAGTGVDGANLVQFLAIGRFFAGRSLLESVHQLLPGEYLVWDGRGVQRRQYASLRLSAADPFDVREVQERLQEALRRAILQRWEVADRPAILLTGGYDSRYIFHTLAEHVADTTALRTVTWGEHLESPGSDAQASAELARRFGTRHVALERRPERVPTLFAEMFQAQSGMTEQAFTHADELALCRELAEEHGIHSLFRGDESFGLTGAEARTVEEALRQVALRHAARMPGAERWLEGHPGWLEAQAAHVSALVAACPPTPSDVRDTLYRDERLPAFLHHLGYYKLHFQEMLNPLLDAEVLRLAATFPAKHRVDKALFKACFHERFARHLDVPFATRSNGVDWRAVLRRSRPLVDFLRAGLEALPAPLRRDFFLERLAEASGEQVPTGGPGPDMVPPEQLVMRAFVLGQWLRQAAR